MKLYLLRHAQSTANTKGVISCKLPGAGLSEAGWKQTLTVSSKIAKLEPVKKVYCSPFRRTIETIKNANLSVAPIIDLRLKELDYGIFNNKNQDIVENEIIRTMGRIRLGNNDVRFGSTGENQREFLTRIYSFLVDIINYNKPVLAVTHESVISVVSRLNRKLRNKGKKKKIKNNQITELSFTKNDVPKILRDLADISSRLKSEEVDTKTGKVLFIWHPDKILENMPSHQVYGFCSNEKNLVALVRDKYESRFTLPGGGIEPEETPKDALVREFIEEAQFQPKNIRLLGSLEVIEKDNLGNIVKRYQQVRFVCRSGKIKEFVPEKDGWETVERIFVPANKLGLYLKWLKYPTGKAQFKKFMEYNKKL